MVFCRQCRKNVEDCEHFVPSLGIAAVNVHDAKVKTVAYSAQQRILEVEFKSGQVWQLLGVPPAIYQELCDTTISSFLRFIARRYYARPVRQTAPSVTAPETEPCQDCQTPMTKRHSTANGGSFMRVLWACSKCNQTIWKTYGTPDFREKKTRWH
jgi:hypothetical protein